MARTRNARSDGEEVKLVDVWETDSATRNYQSQGQESIPLGSLRDDLERMTSGGQHPLRLAFMCLMADHSSPRMMRHFEEQAKYLGLGSYFRSSAIPWGLNPYAVTTIPEHVTQLSRRLSEFDAVLPITPKEGEQMMPLNPWLSQSLGNIPKEARPVVLPFVIEARKRGLFTDLIDKKDYRTLLEDVVHAVEMARGIKK